MPRPKKDPGMMIYVSAPWCTWIDQLAKALSNTPDVDAAEGAIDLIQKKSSGELSRPLIDCDYRYSYVVPNLRFSVTEFACVVPLLT